MHKTITDFQAAAFKLKPQKWHIRDCTLCNYPCGYVFSPDYKLVGYDAGCYCTNSEAIHLRSWEDIADKYNSVTDPVLIAEMDKFWGFSDEQI